MNYRDLILKLLKKRKEVVVVKEVMLADFGGSPDPEEAFDKWCRLNYVQKTAIPGSRNISLTKTTNEAE
jgi:hypothetical protein